jgi:hypothetical protein
MKFQGIDPYYHMKGFGLWAQLYGILGYYLSFVLLSQKNVKIKFLGFITALILIFYLGYILNRKTNTIMYLIGLFMVLYNPFKRKINRTFVLISSFVLVIIATLAFYMLTKNQYQNISEFIMFDLGKFDLLQGFVHNMHRDYYLSAKYFLCETPYSGYIPYIKELNQSIGSESQIAILGKVRHSIGGVPFDLYSKSFAIGRFFFVSLCGLTSGFVWVVAYALAKTMTQNAKNLFPLAVYAIYFSNNVSNSVFFFPTPIFLALFLYLVMGGSYRITRYVE